MMLCKATSIESRQAQAQAITAHGRITRIWDNGLIQQGLGCAVKASKALWPI